MPTKPPKLDTLYPLLKADKLLEYAEKFRDDLIASLSNQPSSLPSILNPVAKNGITPGEGFAVSIGGSNGYASKFTIEKNGDIKFLNRKSFAIPVKTTSDDLFHLITRNIFSVASKKDITLPIGIGLAYALKPKLVDRFLDGELLYMAKGREIKGLVGKTVGQTYHKFLKENYDIDTTVVVGNDAICLLIGGGNVDIAGVVGTGLNFAYWDARQSIAPLKLSTLAGYQQKEVAINIEAKNFDKIPGTVFRDEIDKKSEDKGFSLAEKEVSGAYLFQLFNAGREKLIGPHMPPLTSTDELNDIITKAFVYPKSMTEEKRQLAQSFADRLFHRSAQTVAIELCGILLKIGREKGIIPVVMDGGLFWKAKNYPSLVNQYCHVILPKIIPSFARLYGSARRGIAILAKNGII